MVAFWHGWSLSCLSCSPYHHHGAPLCFSPTPTFHFCFHSNGGSKYLCMILLLLCVVEVKILMCVCVGGRGCPQLMGSHAQLSHFLVRNNALFRWWGLCSEHGPKTIDDIQQQATHLVSRTSPQLQWAKPN